MNKKGVILIADSCFGGISVAKFFLPWSYSYDIHFLADGEKNPFGVKSKNEVKAIVIDWLEYALTIQANLLVIACNTASVSVDDCIDELSLKYDIPIITMVQAFKEMILRKSDSLHKGSVLLYGTSLTIESGVYFDLLLKNHICSFPIKGTYAEHVVARGKLYSASSGIKVEREFLTQYSGRANTIILACTCFYFIKEIILKIFPDSEVLDIAQYVVPIAEKVLNGSNATNYGDIHFYTTGEYTTWIKNFDILSSMIFQRNYPLQFIRIR